MAGFSRTRIYNMALGLLPRAGVGSPNEDSLAAQTCNKGWDLSVQTLLARSDWIFGRVREPLALLDDNDRDGEWGFAYQAPADLAMIVRLLPPQQTLGVFVPQVGQLPTMTAIPENPGCPFDFAGMTIYSNEALAILEYISTDETKAGVAMNALFVAALVDRLAANICLDMTKSADRRVKLMGEAEVSESRAIAGNANARPQTYGNFIPEEALAREGLDPFTQYPAGWRAP